MTEIVDTIGRRIAHARKLRGLTQIGLAGRAHVSKSLIAQVESGHKPATPALIATVSNALSIDVTELTGQPYRENNRRADRIHEAIPAIRQALVYWDIAPDIDTPPRTLDELAAQARRVGSLRMQAAYTEMGDLVPPLLKELVVRAHEAHGAARARAFGLLAGVYAAIDSMACKLGYMDLFALAVERMAWAAGQSDDPLLRPVAAIRRSAAFLTTGAWDGGRQLLDRAAREVTAGSATDQAALSVLGTAHLRSAIMAARAGQADPAWSSIEQARQVADQIGHDTRDYGLLFGPANVSIHEVAVAVELGDADQAVRRAARFTLPADLPRERSSHHYIDLSRAWLWQRDTAKALACVTKAERLAPQRTRYHPMARETIINLLDIRRRTPEQLRGIASRMGLS
jgi:transcriptional regulator with XRE-family HTH domain/tetratricopeptide (TPR) repeat protein